MGTMATRSASSPPSMVCTALRARHLVRGRVRVRIRGRVSEQ